MKRKALKRISIFALVVLMCMAYTACGKKEEETDYIGNTNENVLTLNSDDTVVEIAVQDFTEAEYDYSQLEQYIQDEITSFNGTHTEDSVELLQYEEESGIVRAAIKYVSMDIYNEFNNTDYLLAPYDAEYLNELAAPETDAGNGDTSDTGAEDTGTVSEDELAEAGLSAEDIENLESVPATTTGDDTDEDKEPSVATLTDATGNEVTSDAVTESSAYMLIIEDHIKVRLETGDILYYNKGVSVTTAGDAVYDGEGCGVLVFTK